MKNAKEIYESRRNKFQNLFTRQKQTINFISALRLIIFAAGIGFSIYFYFNKKYYFSLSLFFITIVCFIMLIQRHSRVIKNKNLSLSLININEEALKRIEGKWRDFKDLGEDFIDTEHDFSYDLDLFGKNSLFQWINCCTTSIGRKKLRDILAYPRLHAEEVLKRQEAVEELSKQVDWRQRFRAYGEINIKGESKAPEKLLKWSKEIVTYSSFFKLASFILPVLTVLSIIYYLLNKNGGYSLPLTFIAANVIILKAGEKIRLQVLDTVYEYKKQISIYHDMLVLIENKNFKASMLMDLKDKLIKKDGMKASKAIDSLNKISSKISDRSNFFTVILNIIFLWDYHLITMLLNWKKNYGEEIEIWIEVMGEFEALSSLSVINFDNPNWAVPKLIEGNLSLRAEACAHPLLPRDAVPNDCSIGKPYNILLITGSNMSGKSTFLRTLGINLVLAYAGTRTCAESFSCSLMKIYTCMRISDNLEKNISSFYAEILRIKSIVKAADNEEPVFFLLDEIFKGTNSIDRHLGAETLINKLSEKNVIGLVSTHDLELGDIDKKNSRVKNYHFEEHYKEDKIAFDYKLREGVSTTRNAMYLMKLAGIDFRK